MIQLIITSLYKTNYIVTTFVGLSNYARALTDPVFWQSIKNGALYGAIMIPAYFVMGVGVSLLVVNMSKRVQNYTRFAFYAPVFSAGIIVSQAWRWIFHSRGGLINWIISLIGGEPVIWFLSTGTSIPVVCLILSLSFAGTQILIYLNSMLAIDEAQYDAAIIDGAGWTRIKLQIILPQIVPTIMLMTLVSLIASFQIFEYIYMLCPYEHAATPVFHIFREGFQYGHYGLAAAQSMIMMVIVVSLAVIKRKLEMTGQ